MWVNPFLMDEPLLYPFLSPGWLSGWLELAVSQWIPGGWSLYFAGASSTITTWMPWSGPRYPEEPALCMWVMFGKWLCGSRMKPRTQVLVTADDLGNGDGFEYTSILEHTFPSFKSSHSLKVQQSSYVTKSVSQDCSPRNMHHTEMWEETWRSVNKVENGRIPILVLCNGYAHYHPWRRPLWIPFYFLQVYMDS